MTGQARLFVAGLTAAQVVFGWAMLRAVSRQRADVYDRMAAAAVWAVMDTDRERGHLTLVT